MRFALRTSLLVLPVLVTAHLAVASDAPLIEAVKKADSRAFRALMQSRVDVNSREVDGTTALHWAAYRGDAAMAQTLLTAGANANATNRYGVTPLSLAAATGNPTLVRHLVQGGAKVNDRPAGGATPLMVAARNGHTEVLKYLIAHGADVNAFEDSRGQTALMWAAERDNGPAVKLLAEAGAELEVRSKGPASRVNSTDKVRGIERLFNLDTKRTRIDEYAALHFAARAGATNAARALLAAGANPNSISEDGMTPVVLAAFNANWETGVAIVEGGADPNAAKQGWTALHQIARTRGLSRTLLPNPVPKGRLTALDLAEALIAHGADVNARVTKPITGDQERGRFVMIDATPILIAAKSFDANLMRLLAANGADRTLGNKANSTILSLAAGCEVSNVGEDSGPVADSRAAVEVAWGLGGDVNHVASKAAEAERAIGLPDGLGGGDTPLHCSAFIGAGETARFLLERGAKLDAKNAKGLTPLAIAAGYGERSSAVPQPAVIAVLKHFHELKGVPIEPPELSELVSTFDQGSSRASESSAR